MIRSLGRFSVSALLAGALLMPIYTGQAAENDAAGVEPVGTEAYDHEAGDPAAKRGATDGRLWAEAGPCWIASNDLYTGVRLAVGADALLGKSRRLFMGGYLTRYFSSEALTDDFAGGIHRLSLIPALGYFVLPDRLWLRAGVGLSLLTGSNDNFGAKLKPVLALAVGYQIPIHGTSKLGLKFSWEHTGEARRSIYSLVTSLGCAFGACESTGVVPLSNVYALSLMYVFSP